MLGTAEEYRRNAEEAEKRAARAISPAEREQHRVMARAWRQLADDAEGPFGKAR